MKIIRLNQQLTTDLEFEFEDYEADYIATFLDERFPEVEYEVIEKAANP